MQVEPITGGWARRARFLVTGVLLAGVTACGATAPAEPPRDPATQAYCDTVARVQAEQAGPGAGQSGIAAEAAATRRGLADLVRTSPPEIARDWRYIEQLTDRSLAFLERTGGDARRIDRGALDRLRRAAEPSQARVATVTEQRCGIAFRAPG